MAIWAFFGGQDDHLAPFTIWLLDYGLRHGGQATQFPILIIGSEPARI